MLGGKREQKLSVNFKYIFTGERIKNKYFRTFLCFGSSSSLMSIVMKVLFNYY